MALTTIGGDKACLVRNGSTICARAYDLQRVLALKKMSRYRMAQLKIALQSEIHYTLQIG